VQVGVQDNGAGTAASADFGFGVLGVAGTPPTSNDAGGGEVATETIRFSAASGELARLEDEFDNIRDQINQLVTNGDTGYRGTNLLNGDNLTTFFNEFRTSELTTEGVTF